MLRAGTVGLLVSWTNLVHDKNISAAEAFLVLSLTNLLAMPGFVVGIISQLYGIFGGFFLASSQVYTMSSSLLFWGKLYASIALSSDRLASDDLKISLSDFKIDLDDSTI
jgi:hypothetical protein